MLPPNISVENFNQQLGEYSRKVKSSVNKDSQIIQLLSAVHYDTATPIARYSMHQWLQDYVYRINISWWLFAAGGLVAIIIALVTISFQAIKAAIANPVKSLRTE